MLKTSVFELSCQGQNSINGFRINGVSAGDYSGNSLASAGDINGDGFSDLIIGAWFAAPYGKTQAGSSFVVFGTNNSFNATVELSDLNGSNGFRINGVSLGDNSGKSVASAGDINGDGFGDLIIGAYDASPTSSSFVVFGTNNSFNATLELSALNGANGFRINGASDSQYSGYSVASAGDINGDGLSDLLIGAPYATPGGGYVPGSSFVVFGTNNSFNATLELSTLNGANGFRINGVSAGDQSGNSVASAGDMNNDGFSDLIIGAWTAGSTGSSFVVFGTNNSFNASLELSTLNGINGFRINGVSVGDLSGYSVASVGDMNNDGFGDIVIGAPDASPGNRTHAGSSFVLFGTNNSFNATLELSALNGVNGFRINGVSAGDESGISVASAGDINNDGYTDLIIGADRASPSGGQHNSGSSFIVFGTNKNFSSILELFDLDGINGFRINGVSPNDGSGISVASAGDMNNDGLNDIIIGASYASPGGRVGAGSSFVLFSDNNKSIQLSVNQMIVTEGSSQILSSLNLNTPLSSLNNVYYSINTLLHGKFEYTTQPGISITCFSNQDVVMGQINFTHDDGELAPSYLVTAAYRLAAANIIFINQLPTLVNNNLSIHQGQILQLNSSMLAAVDLDNPQHNSGIIFTLSNVSNGVFSTCNFSQAELWNGSVRFSHDNLIHAPNYTVYISRAGVTAGPYLPTIDFHPTPLNITKITNIQTTDTGAIVGGVIGVVTGLGLVFGLQWYLKRKTNAQLQRILLEGTTDAEKEFNRDVVRPIANKIFNLINTTGIFGQRSDADTKAYMLAIGKIVSELRRQNANLDFSKMEPIDKEAFLNEIANQTRQQSLPQHKGFFGNCTRYFKAEATPQEIEHAADNIALAVVAWQKRHMNSVVVKNTGSLEHQSDYPQRQMNWMQQNHVNALENRENEELQQEMKRLKEQLALQEVELAAFRRQAELESFKR